MTTLSIELPTALKKKLETQARRLGISPARFVRAALETHLKHLRNNGRRSLYEASSDICGSVRGGPHDLASNPKHLAGYGAWKR